jgi:hypothetical protein
MNKQPYSLPDINGLLSLPTEEVMKYGIEHDILDSPWLLAHIILCRILVFQMAKALPKNIDFDMDTALSLTTVYHATRQAADYGKAWKHPDSLVNEFMKTRGDMDYALNQAIEHWFTVAITQWVWNYRINPNSREAWYFPHESLMKNSKINWTEAIPMLTSWLVVWPMTKTSIRFQDLRDRRSGEIGKLELPFWQKKISEWEDIALPQPIIDTAILDKTMSYKSEGDIVDGIRNGSVTNEVMWRWILDGYEQWANTVISEYCRIAKIDDFYKYLEYGVDTVGDYRSEKKTEIKKSFEKLIGRSLAQDEFIPYVEWLDLVFKRIWWLKVSNTKELYRQKLTRTMENIERTISFLSKEKVVKNWIQNHGAIQSIKSSQIIHEI